MKIVKEIARMRDGGSLLIECEGIRYFYDYGIGSETKGELFFVSEFNGVTTLRFARVPHPENRLIINAIYNQVPNYSKQ